MPAQALRQQDRLAVLHDVYEAWNQRDVERGLAAVASDAEWWGPAHSPFAGPFRGHAEIRRFARSMLDMFDELVRTPLAFDEAGDRICVEVRSYARGTASGASIDVLLWDVWTFRHEKLVRYQVFDDRAAARAALTS